MRQYTIFEKIPIFSRVLLHMPSFLRTSSKNRREIEKKQLRKLQKILLHAYRDVPFYREKFNKHRLNPQKIRSIRDFQKYVPFTTKDEILENYPLFFPREQQLKKMILSHSSGSSGKFLKIYHKPINTYPYILGRYRNFRTITDYGPFTKVFYIYTSLYPAQSVFGLYRFYFTETLNDIDDTKAGILKVKPHILNLYPSHLAELAKVFRRPEIRELSLRCILVGSEMSSQSQRDELGKIFNCPVYDEYSSEELGWISSQCKHKTYHCFEDLNFLEVIDESGEVLTAGKPGEIVGTNLCNTVMPFIRYKQGDRASLHLETCPCGSNFLVMKNLVGRKNQSLVIHERTFSSGYLLDLCYNIILKLKAQVLDFCLFQKIDGQIILELILKEENKAEIPKIRDYFYQHLNTPCEVKIVDVLTKTKTGKRNPIFSLIPPTAHD